MARAYSSPNELRLSLLLSVSLHVLHVDCLEQIPAKIVDCTQQPTYNKSEPELVAEALQDCINSVAAAGGRSMAYIPAGSYLLEKPLKIPAGKDFWVSGSGYATQLVLHPNLTQATHQAVEVAGDSSWIAAPNPEFPAHFEIVAGAGAAGTNVRVDGFMFQGNNWKDLKNITHDLCSVRVSTSGAAGVQQAVSAAPPAAPGANVYLDWLL